jgi:hypothetical protein
MLRAVLSGHGSESAVVHGLQRLLLHLPRTSRAPFCEQKEDVHLTAKAASPLLITNRVASARLRNSKTGSVRCDAHSYDFMRMHDDAELMAVFDRQPILISLHSIGLPCL